MSTSPRIAAFFDLDRTLLTVNSGALWIKNERRHGRISAWQMVQGSFYVLAYKFSGLDMERLMVKALQSIKGVEEETIRQRTHAWYREEVAQFSAPGATAVLDDHRSKGHMLVLLTASSLFESEVASKQFGLDAYLCTRYELHEGRFTGDVERPLCYGAGKVTHAERLAAEQQIDLDHSYFYTDSFTDLPMLDRVGHPVVVAPDPRLRRIAKKRGWPVLDWSGEVAPAD